MAKLSKLACDRKPQTAYPCIFHEDHSTWFANFRDLGCVTCGDTPEEAIANAHEALQWWLLFGDSSAPSTALETAAWLEEGDFIEMIEAGNVTGQSFSNLCVNHPASGNTGCISVQGDCVCLGMGAILSVAVE